MDYQTGHLFVALSISNAFYVHKHGRVPLLEWTGMELITGMDYRNGHLTVALSTLNEI